MAQSSQIELLAPAKSLETLRAAVDCGADAIYIGAKQFGARTTAGNSVEDIAAGVAYAHRFGVRVYVALNTLLYDDELESARTLALELIDVGVDALIIQDMAYTRMGLPIELHASTQMCNMTLEGVRFLRDCGFRRIVMERNLSLQEIREITKALPDIEVETFIHGAICVGYSGHCYLSRCTSSRSGNRGDCSQPCRLSYDLEDGKGQKIVRGRHLLSLKDLNLTEAIDDLLDCGVHSLKIEGRLKDINYVRNIVAHYNRELNIRGVKRSSWGESSIEFTPNPAKSFAREHSLYMSYGASNGGVASFDSPKALGQRVGVVTKMDSKGYFISGEETLATGDGVCFFKRGELVGSNINRVEKGTQGFWVTLNGDHKIERGTELYRNYDRLFEGRLSRSRTRRTIGVLGQLQSNPTEIRVRYCDPLGNIAEAYTKGAFSPAENRDRMLSAISEQLGRCAPSIFSLEGEVDTSGWGGEFIPLSQLSSLRREALSKMELYNRAPASRAFVERLEVRYPSKRIGAEVGVTNHLARSFYTEHGVEHFEHSLECRDSLEGERVLATRYCIRREMGECTLEGGSLPSELYLVRGAARYRVECDCKRCEMRLIKM